MKKRARLIVSAFLVLIYSATSLAPASAAVTAGSSAPATSTTSSGLSIVPRKNYNIRPGQSVTDKLTIGNLSHTSPLIISLNAIDFTFTDETGTPKLMLAQNAPQTTWSLKPFMTLPQSFTIAPSKTITVNFTIKIPAKQGAGSYYSALEYAAKGADGKNVNLSATGVTLVFVSVPGIVNEHLTLKKLGAYQPDATGTGGGYVFIATNPPEDIGYTLQNDSNVAENPAGSIVLHNQLFSKKISIDNANPSTSLALIGQTRLFTACIQHVDKVVTLGGNKSVTTVCKQKPSLWPGPHSISLDVYYGQNGNNSQEITGSATFWYLPWWFIIPALAVIILILYFAWRLWNKVQRAVGGKPAHRNRR